MNRFTSQVAGRVLTPVVLLALCVDCGGSGHGGSSGNTTPVPGVPSTQSSSIALSVDGNFLVNVNPDAGTVSVFQPAAMSKLAEITVGGDPQSVAIHPSQPRAYVANARSGTVSVVPLPNGPVSNTIVVGSEPMALALSPNGTRLYVANSASNTISVLDTSTNLVTATVDLSSFGSAPRGVSVTNNGNLIDTDETIYVAMFFAQLRAGKTFLDEGQDDQREGRVVAISAATNLPAGGTNPVLLAPMTSAGFNGNGKLAPAPAQVPSVASTNPQTFTTPTGAFPNQLASIALRPGSTRAYVVSTGASPNGPLRFNSMVQGLVSVFDTTTGAEITAVQTDPTLRRTAPLNMNQGVNLGTAPRLFLSNPVAMT